MKKLVIAFIPWLFSAFSYKAMAQDETKDKKSETQEITIHKKGDKDATITVEIKGDKVLINGKPMAEFNDSDITINNKKIIMRDGNKIFFGDGFDDFDGTFSWSDDKGGGRTFLGVSTEKADGGARVTEITKESAAEKAGLQKDDVITKVNDKKIDGPQMLSEVITSMKPKDEVKVYFKRNGKEKNVKAILQERKDWPRSFTITGPNGSVKSLTIPRAKTWDMDHMNPIPPMPPDGMNDFDFNYTFPRQQRLGLKIQDTEEGNGVKVIDIEENSAAAKAGLQENDIITEIGGKKIINTDEARAELKENKDKTSYAIKARRNGKEMTFDIKIPKKLKTANL